MRSPDSAVSSSPSLQMFGLGCLGLCLEGQSSVAY